MSTKITIEITVADDQAYTAREAQILAAIQAHPSQGAAAVVAPAPVAKAAAPAAKVEPKPVVKKAPVAPSSASSNKAAVLDTTLDAVEEPEEDLVGEEEPVVLEATFTLEDAVSLATKFVSEGKSAAVKAALGTVGAKRVSELKGDAIGTFVNELKS